MIFLRSLNGVKQFDQRLVLAARSLAGHWLLFRIHRLAAMPHFIELVKLIFPTGQVTVTSRGSKQQFRRKRQEQRKMMRGTRPDVNAKLV